MDSYRRFATLLTLITQRLMFRIRLDAPFSQHGLAVEVHGVRADGMVDVKILESWEAGDALCVEPSWLERML